MQHLNDNTSDTSRIKNTDEFDQVMSPIVVEDEILFKRYLTLRSRRVQYPPSDKVVEWDIVGCTTISNPTFVVVFPYHKATKSVTLIKEYAQGVDRMIYTLPSGGIDPIKHQGNPLITAQYELSEEAHLTGGQMIPLLPAGHPGICELKWCTNTFLPFLSVDADFDPAPLDRDLEECIEVHTPVSISDLWNLIRRGEFMLPALQTAIMALEYIKERGL